MADNFNAFLKIFDKPLQEGQGTLDAVTVAVKDNILIKGEQATASSKILEGFIAPYDATVIKRLKAAGAILVGKTNLDEFAMGSSTESSAWGPTLNPWDTLLVPGGSSGGSAVAVATDQAQVALGSDTAGSIRQPAAFCGVTGLKPTYGSVSRYGLIAMASSLDVIGPFARTAEQIEQVFSVISGRDQNDQTTIDYHYEPIDTDLTKLKIGLPKEFWELSIDPEITEATHNMVKWYQDQGATVTEVSLPSLKYGLPAYYIIMPAEVMANLARFDGIRYRSSVDAGTLVEKYLKTRSTGFGTEVKRRIIMGAFVLSVGHYDDYYQKAAKIRRLIEKEYEEAFKKVDVLMSAVTPTLPFKLGSKTQDPLAMYQSDLLTVSANLAGVPAISVPCGFSSSGLPIGGQLIASQTRDNVLIDLVKKYQTATNHHLKKPKI